MSLITELKFIDDPNEKSALKGADIDLHDHLTDNADWDAEFWDFDEEYLQEYSEKLRCLFFQSINGIEFQSLWVGESPTKIVELSLDDFLEVVQRNKIGTTIKYVVRKRA